MICVLGGRIREAPHVGLGHLVGLQIARVQRRQPGLEHVHAAAKDLRHGGLANKLEDLLEADAEDVDHEDLANIPAGIVEEFNGGRKQV